MPPEGALTGEAVFLAELATIERVVAFVARRHHLSADAADEFDAHVKLKLVEDDYAVLRKFQGRSSLRTYLTVVIQRIFLDYRVSAWGKWRPSAEARRAGEVAMLFERLTSRDGHTVEEAFELITTNHRVAITREELERLAARLPLRSGRRFEGDDRLVDMAAATPPPDAGATGADDMSAADRIARALRRQTSGLPAQDRLVLALRFEDGRSVAEIAAMLRLDQKALYRRIDRLLRGLRGALEAAGVSAQAVSAVLANPDATAGWNSAGGSVPTGGSER